MSDESFCKLYRSIVHSSVWSEDYATRIVWVTMLALKDREGIVDASVPGLARAANVTRPEVEAALKTLTGADPDDRSGVDNGRRVVVEPGRGWRVVNHDRYRERGRTPAPDRVERARQAGIRSAESRRAKLGTAVPENATNRRATERPEPNTDPNADPDPDLLPAAADPDPPRARAREVQPERRQRQRDPDPEPDHGSSPTRPVARPEPGLSRVSGSGPTRGSPGSKDASDGQPGPLTEICQKAREIQRNPWDADFLGVAQWPEVVAVAEALARAQGHGPPRLGAYSRDGGVKAVVNLLAAGFSVDELVGAVPSVVGSEWWQQRTRGLSSLSPEVVRRALDQAPPKSRPKANALGTIRHSHVEDDESRGPPISYDEFRAGEIAEGRPDPGPLKASRRIGSAWPWEGDE